MRRGHKPIRYAISLLAAAVILGSCASKPPSPPPPEPQPAPVAAPAEPAPAPEPAAPAVSQEELDKLLAEAKALKKRAFDLKLYEVLPEDYKAADAKLAEGQKAYDAKDAEAAKAGLGVAISAYKDLVAKGIVEIAKAKRHDAEEMRAMAEKAGADKVEAERFGAGAEALAAAAALQDGSKDEEAIPGFERARLYFELAWKRSQADGLYAAIADKDYAKWDSGNYQRAESKYRSEEGLWASGKDGDRSAGVDALDEAILRFNLVAQKGREMAAGAVKDRTDERKRRSVGIKADVAARELFDSAQGIYGEGSGLLAAKDYEKASEAFEKAASAFDEAYDLAAVKRAKAQAAMQAADEATAESARKAGEADPLLQGGTK